MSPPASGLPTIFEQAIGAISSAHVAMILSCMDEWRRRGLSDPWCQVVTNIETETALPVADLAVLLTDFASAMMDGARPEKCWVDVCRERHQFKGSRFPWPQPAVVGRAAPIRNYSKVISDSPDVGLTPDQCEALLRKVAMAGNAVHPRDARILSRAFLGRYLLWATFCIADTNDSPFNHVHHTTDAIRTALGLGTCAETETLVLVSYRTQGARHVIELFRPTIGDAEGYSWYRPHPDPASGHGMTCPLPPNASRLPPQPEVVHRETTGETLIFPIHLTT